MDNNEQSIENIMNNANQYKDDIISRIESKIAELNSLAEEIKSGNNEIISGYIESAKKFDIRYIPDTNILNSINSWVSNLGIVKEKLAELELNQDDVFEQEIYLQKAEELLDLIDKKLIEERSKFVKANMERFKNSFGSAKENEAELKIVNSELEELEKVSPILKTGNSLREKVRIFNKSKILNSASEQLKRIEELKRKKVQLELAISANHYVPFAGNTNSNIEVEEDKEKEGVEPGDN